MRMRKCLTALMAAALWAGNLIAEETSSLQVEIMIGTAVEDRQLVGAADAFTSDTPQLVGWTRILGAKEPTEIKHVWKVDGQEVSTVALNVQSSSFRTFSRKNLYGRAGAWTLEVRDADGHVIASKDFEVTVAPKQ